MSCRHHERVALEDAAGVLGARLSAIAAGATVRCGPLRRVVLLPAVDLVVRLADHESAGAVAAEVAVASYLAGVGAPTELLADGLDAPLIAGPVVASVWRYLGPARPATFADVGRLLAQLHHRSAPAPSPISYSDVPGAVVRHLRVAERSGAPGALLATIRARLEPLAARWDAAKTGSARVVIHADAHPANVAGGRLVDLELAGVGPPGYDLAAAAVATTRYGDRDALAALTRTYAPGANPVVEPAWVELYELWVTAWALARWDEPGLRAEAQRRVAGLAEASRARWRRR
ncbi:MAG: aminoglycoside phosphotransferase family protein [Actinomycetota bacterium]|jgi:hypothetical protein